MGTVPLPQEPKRFLPDHSYRAYVRQLYGDAKRDWFFVINNVTLGALLMLAALVVWLALH